ncbi:MAG TPA: nucleoside-diphosphate sugar epimerase [Phycisphaerales bacterium]|nr:nucleoside-diphosphate sugar epimerase [Phycisphaerales bacterium]|tara:strand:+ start:26097 stop:27059 length:963 start_codon:yes stop_codon:yes gene_type:complete
MKVLITGGAGFIGSHLCETMLSQGHQVIAIDDLSTGSHTNIAHLESNRDFQMVVDTVLDTQLINQLIRECDQVLHLASAVGVQLIIDQPTKTIQTIVEGTRVVLDAAKRYRRPVLITSTSEVYGKGSKIPFSEDDDIVLGPTSTRRWLYASAKMLDEFLGLAHWYETRLPVTIVRLFNTVGPRQIGQYGMVLPRFVQKALKGDPLTVYGDGKQARCFCHVSDAVTALIKLSQCKDGYGKVINVGSEEEISILELAQKVIAMTDSQSEIEFLSYEKAYTQGFDDMQRRVPDLARIKELVGYRPDYDLSGVIQSTIAYWQNQ